MPIPPKTANVVRQFITLYMLTTSHGVTAAAIRAPAALSPSAMGRSSIFSHELIIFAMAGKQPASPAPKRNRVITIDVAQREDETAKPDPLFLINPEILWKSDEVAVAEEGCLSIPEYFAEVERPASVRVAYIDRDGKGQEIEANGVLAVCLQHEIDHIDGKLFIDHLSKLKRDMVIKKFAKQAKKPIIL